MTSDENLRATGHLRRLWPPAVAAQDISEELWVRDRQVNPVDRSLTVISDYWSLAVSSPATRVTRRKTPLIALAGPAVFSVRRPKH